MHNCAERYTLMIIDVLSEDVYLILPPPQERKWRCFYNSVQNQAGIVTIFYTVWGFGGKCPAAFSSVLIKGTVAPD
jgi:hypothetical protein